MRLSPGFGQDVLGALPDEARERVFAAARRCALLTGASSRPRRAGHRDGLLCHGVQEYSGTMLSLEDCIALCDLTEEEVLAIAEHEHIPEIAATELGNYLLRTPDGELYIKSMIRDDIHAANARNERERVLTLKAVLRNFILQHPRCDERHRRQLHQPERRAC
jgi:hypothetical protein